MDDNIFSAMELRFKAARRLLKIEAATARLFKLCLFPETEKELTMRWVCEQFKNEPEDVAELTVACTGCGCALAPRAKFCLECGARPAEKAADGRP